MRTNIAPTEDEEQAAVVAWCDVMGIPCVHVPNEGKRSYAYGARMRRLGLRKGFPDLFFPVPKGKYHGLFVEMKSQNGKATKEQKEWLRMLSANGYQCWICNGAEKAKQAIEEYMNQR